MSTQIYTKDHSISFQDCTGHYASSYNNNRGVSSDLERMLKDFITSQKAFNKIIEEKLEKLDNLIVGVVETRVPRAGLPGPTTPFRRFR